MSTTPEQPDQFALGGPLVAEPPASLAELIALVADQPAGVTRGELATIVGDLLGGVGSLDSLLAQMEWAEQEIDDACRRHPQHADRVHHSFWWTRR